MKDDEFTNMPFPLRVRRKNKTKIAELIQALAVLFFLLTFFISCWVIEKGVKETMTSQPTSGGHGSAKAPGKLP